MNGDGCAITIGLVVSIPVGAFMVCLARFPLRKNLKFKDDKQEYRAVAVGIVERGLYLGSVVFNFPAFIGIWLALKTATGWSERKQAESPIPQARAQFSVNIIGNGVSIAYGVAGGLVILHPDMMPTVLVSLGVITLLLLLVIWIGAWMNPIPAPRRGQARKR